MLILVEIMYCNIGLEKESSFKCRSRAFFISSTWFVGAQGTILVHVLLPTCYACFQRSSLHWSANSNSCKKKLKPKTHTLTKTTTMQELRLVW